MSNITIYARPGQYGDSTIGYYAAVIHGHYNPRSEAYEWMYDENHGTFVRAKKLANTVQRLKDGHDHITADPVNGLTRYEAGYLLANANEILKTINGTKFAYPSAD